MALARFEHDFTDDEGNLIAVAGTATVRREDTGALATLYSDRAGATQVSNPLNVSDGQVAFHVAGGSYKVTLTYGAETRELRYRPLGTAAEYDAEALGKAGYAFTFESATTAPPSASSIRANNADLSLATKLYIDDETLGATNVSATLLDLDPDGNTTKHRIRLTVDAVDAVFDVTGATDQTDYVELDVNNHDGATSLNVGTARVNIEWAGADIADSVMLDITHAVADRTALKALDITRFNTAFLQEGGREGVFDWDGSDISGTVLGPAINSSDVSSTLDIFTSSGHGLYTGNAVVSTSAVNGLSTNTLYYAIGLRKIDYDAETAAFAVGETLTGGSSAATGEIVKVTDAGTTGTIFLKNVVGVFEDDETITDSATGSATADGAAIRDADSIQLATSYSNAVAGTELSLTGTSATTIKQHLDRAQGIYVTPDADITGSSGAWVRKYEGKISAKWFGVVGDWNGSSGTDNTEPMNAAHSTGAVIFYPEGRYRFSILSMTTGGIVGEGKNTILDSSDTSTADLIVHNGGDNTSLLVNELGAVFQDFYLRVNTSTQKSSGAGIKIDPGTTNENYTSIVDNVTIRNVPTSVWTTNSSFITIQNCYFAFFSDYGVYEDNNVAAFEDNGDNGIINNWFYTTRPNAFCIKYRGGGGRIIGNKMNGGLIGLDISPLRSSSIIVCTGNSIENQTINCIRGISESDAVATAFAGIIITSNQINASSCAGSAIYFNTSAYYVDDVVIANNYIRFYTDLTAAIDLRKIDEFSVTGNLIECNSLGYRGIQIESTCSNGQVNDNNVVGYTNAHTVNSSTTAVEDRVIGFYSATYNPPSIAAGAVHSVAVTLTGAAFGDIIEPTFDISLASITLTAYVSAADTVTFLFSNNTAGAIDLGSSTLRAVARRTRTA